MHVDRSHEASGLRCDPELTNDAGAFLTPEDW